MGCLEWLFTLRYDPDGALADQIEMIKYLKEKESYTFVNYSDLLKME